MTHRTHGAARAHPLALLPVAALLALAGQAQAAQQNFNPRQRPAVLRGPILETVYDGVSNDLLTAGLGKTGLMGAAPAFVDPLAPTANELRRNAIYNNYRALVDPTALGGMGVLYGPNIDVHGNDTLGEGKIAGREYIVWADDGSGHQNVTLMVQVPDSFTPQAPCIITATSSGSRGVYGAIATSGEWGLKHGCAVAYTDKGTGNGLHDLMTGAVMARDGTLLNAATAGTEAQFQAPDSPDDIAAFNAATPHRVAYKHAHSQQNPEKDWGRSTLDAVRFAFYVLNQRYAPAPVRAGQAQPARITPSNTLVIASSVSNGGGAALAAAEQDKQGLIDGVAVSEPNGQARHTPQLVIQQGARVAAHAGKPLADYFTYANVYQPCAILSSQAGLSLNAAFWPQAYTDAANNRCAALAARGLVGGSTPAEWADDALAHLLNRGWQPESNFLQQSHFRFATNAIAVTYVNAAGRFSVTDKVCGYSLANTDGSGNVAPQNPYAVAGIFASGNGVPPTTGVNIVYNDAVGGAKLDFLAVSPTSGQADFALDGALCLRSLVAGKDAVTGGPLPGPLQAQSARVRHGMGEVRLQAKLHGLPTVIVQGRSDALLPVNHTGRAWFGRNQLLDPQAGTVRYIEVTNAQHFDSFIGFGGLLGYDTRFVPLHPYLNRALDAVWAHLREGAALPPSQVVRTTPRPTSTTPISWANVPPMSGMPPTQDQIVTSGSTLVVPD
jgi:hydroxybutyrate-dimer hydrolase